jgi:hypothetical protein
MVGQWRELLAESAAAEVLELRLAALLTIYALNQSAPW